MCRSVLEKKHEMILSEDVCLIYDFVSVQNFKYNFFFGSVLEIKI